MLIQKTFLQNILISLFMSLLVHSANGDKSSDADAFQSSVDDVSKEVEAVNKNIDEYKNTIAQLDDNVKAITSLIDFEKVKSEATEAILKGEGFQKAAVAAVYKAENKLVNVIALLKAIETASSAEPPSEDLTSAKRITEDAKTSIEENQKTIRDHLQTIKTGIEKARTVFYVADFNVDPIKAVGKLTEDIKELENEANLIDEQVKNANSASKKAEEAANLADDDEKFQEADKECETALKEAKDLQTKVENITSRAFAIHNAATSASTASEAGSNDKSATDETKKKADSVVQTLEKNTNGISQAIKIAEEGKNKTAEKMVKQAIDDAAKKKMADELQTIIDEVKNDVAGVKNEITNDKYEETTNKLETYSSSATPNSVKTNAKKAIKEGEDFEEKAYETLHSIENVLFKVIAKATPADATLADAETKAKTNQQNLEKHLITVNESVKSIQSEIVKAHKAFWTADLKVNADTAVKNLEIEANKMTNEATTISDKAKEARNKSSTALQAANRLPSSPENFKNVKKDCDDALETARDVEIKAERLKIQAGAVSEAAELSKAELSTSIRDISDKVKKDLKSAFEDISFSLNEAKKGSQLVAIAEAKKEPKEEKKNKAGITSTVEEDKKKEQEQRQDQQQKKQAKLEAENRRLKEQLEAERAKQGLLPLDENGQPINIANYNNEVYSQLAPGDKDVSCLNRLHECATNAAMQTICAGTCYREMKKQDHGNNCGTMADLCGNTVYADMMRVYCKGTCG